MRLPRECRFPDGETEVVVRRVGRKVVLEPIDQWSKEFEHDATLVTNNVKHFAKVPGLRTESWG